MTSTQTVLLPVDSASQNSIESKIPGAVFVFYNGCLASGSNGSQARAGAALSYLVRTFDQVVLYSFSDHATEPWTPQATREFHEAFPTVKLVTESGRLARIVTRFKNLALKVAPARAGAILKLHVPRITPAYDELLRDLPKEARWFINYADGLTQLNGIPSTNVFVETHDIKFISHCKAKIQALNSIASLLRMRSEVAILSAAKAVIAISPVEEAFFRLTLPVRTFYVPTYGDLPGNIERNKPGAWQYDMLFVGSENVLNVRGLVDLYSVSGTWLRNHKVALAGKICYVPEIKVLAATFGLHLLGFISDLSKTYQLTKACLSPTDGTGLKIKLVEALQHGKPVFASQHSMDGLPPGYENCVFPINSSVVGGVLDSVEVLKASEEAAVHYATQLSRFSHVNDLTEFFRTTCATQTP